MNIHAKIYELSESLGLKKIKDNHYQGIFIVTEEIVDDCEVYDYECRFLFLDIRKNEKDIFFYIGSADDSEVAYFSPKNSSESLDYIFNEILNLFKDEPIELPWYKIKEILQVFDFERN